MNDWFETLDGLRAHVWHHLLQGVANRDSAARHPVLATQSLDGWPEARTVVLRAADEQSGTVEAHTDLFSDKIASLRNLPRAALHVWEAEDRLQIRLSLSVEIQSGEAVAALWARVPDHSRQSYGVTPPPGTPIARALDYDKTPDPASFAVLRCTVQTIDAVHLGPVHRRATYRRDDGWTGQWLSP